MDAWMESDGWMDSWSRPNHMPSHLDALRTMASVAFRRRASDSHSVAKQALFCIALGIDFQGFWRPKWTPKFGFRGFFDVIFQCV